jgi:DNA-binding Xre family transcriptional regulator
MTNLYPLQSNLQEILKRKNLSMKGLSIKAGLGETAVRDIIKGRVRSPTYLTLEKIATVLKCNVQTLIENR